MLDMDRAGESRHRFVRWLVPTPTRNPAGTVYGILVVGSLLAAEGARGVEFGHIVGAVALALVMYWLAHAYADVLGQRLQTTDRRSWRRLGRTLLHEWAIIRGATLPLIVLCVVAAAGAGVQGAINAALGTCAVMIVALEVVAGIGEDLAAGEIALEALVGVVLGLGLFALKILLH